MPEPVDFDALRSFIAVAETLAFSVTAERLAISKPALTRRIQRLEAAIGCPLLERSTRHVALTQAGHLFLPRARQVAQELDDAIRAMRDHARSRAGHLTIASLPSITARLLPRIIRDFRVAWPEMRLRVIQCSADAILHHLRDGVAEFGFSVQASGDGDLHFDPIAADPFCLVMPPDHPLAAQDRVAWRELGPHVLITAGTETADMVLLEDALRGIDWHRDSAYEIDHLTTSLGLVEAGLGITVVPHSALPPEPSADLAIRLMVEPEVTRTLGLFRRRSDPLSPLAQQFLATARRVGRLSRPRFVNRS